MNGYKPLRIVFLGMASLLLSTMASAETAKIEGLIKGRSGPTMAVHTKDGTTVTVVLTDSTNVSQIQGVLKVRRKDMSMAALIPGLAVQVEGSYDAQNRLIATSVKFEGSDLEQAQSVQAGLHETRTDVEKHDAELKQQNDALRKAEADVAANSDKIAANKALVEAAIVRFGQLDDYYILDESTVHFGNGKVAVDAKYQAPLLELARKAKNVEGYMVQVTGYASASGNTALNQKLSEDRASNVTNLLIQQGNIPLTNLLAPGAMGESRQIGEGKSSDTEAQNRRVVVRVLQNKGVAGLKELHEQPR